MELVDCGSQMARLLLIRHAQSTWNADGRWQGWADPPLTGFGRKEARRAGRWLAQACPALGGVVSSDLRRARETAEILSDRLGIPHGGTERQLRERHVGDWQGRTRDEIESLWPGMLDQFREGVIETPPGGEPMSGFIERVTGALARVAADGAGRARLVVTHAGVIRGLERALGTEHCSVVHLSGRWFEVGDDGEVTAGEPAGPWLTAAN